MLKSHLPVEEIHNKILREKGIKILTIDEMQKTSVNN